MKNIILLATSIIVSLLFVVFASSIFEAGYYEREFSNEMYNQNLYFVVSIIILLLVWGGAAAFYYAINSVSFSRWWHWLSVMVDVSLLSSVINFMYPSSIFQDLSYDVTAQLFSFSVVVFVITAVLFTIVSFGIRWWSTNCRHTPIPE